VIPWLEAKVTKTPEQPRQLAEDPRTHRFTMVAGRKAYRPELFGSSSTAVRPKYFISRELLV
jgi:hypothetical protein